MSVCGDFLKPTSYKIKQRIAEAINGKRVLKSIRTIVLCSPRDWGLPAQPISIRKAQSRKESHKPLRACKMCLKKCAVFDNHRILLF